MIPLAAAAPAIGSAISAGANLYAGSQAASSTAHQNELNRQFQQGAADLAYLRQREFAQSGIQWRVEDAIKAGIHPIYALGGSGATYSHPSMTLSAEAPGKAAAPFYAAMGQDVGRAIAATSSQDTRMTAAMQALALNKGQLENDLLRSQIARIKQQTGPGMPSEVQRFAIPGQGDTVQPTVTTSDIKEKPMERTPMQKGNPWAEPGAVSDVGWAETVSGGLVPITSKDVKERIEDNVIQEALWALRNNILPYLGLNKSPPPIGRKEDWYMDWKGEYHPAMTGKQAHRWPDGSVWSSRDVGAGSRFNAPTFYERGRRW